MRDFERLHAEAEEAEVRGEMARSQLLAAKASVRERSVRWSRIHSRGPKIARSADGIERTTRPQLRK